MQSNKKKVVFFQPFIGPYRIDFTNDLCSSFELELFLNNRFSKKLAFDANAILKEINCSPTFLPIKNKIKLIYILWRKLTQFNPDVVISFEYDLKTLFIILYRVITRGKYKIIGMCDDSYDMVISDGFTLLHKIARRIMVPFLDDVILVEPQVVDWYQKEFGKGYFFPILRKDDVVRAKYRSAVKIKTRVVEKYKLTNKFVFLYVGRLVAIKNVEALIRAYAKLNQDSNTLVIVGSGPEEERLRHIASELGSNVIFTGRLEGDELNVWYNIANTFVLPSLLEPFGAVVNEALLGGCNCVVSRRAGSRCLVEDGKNGFVVDPESQEDIVSKLEKSKMLLQSNEENEGLRDNKMIYKYGDMIVRLFDHIAKDKDLIIA